MISPLGRTRHNKFPVVYLFCVVFIFVFIIIIAYSEASTSYLRSKSNERNAETKGKTYYTVDPKSIDFGDSSKETGGNGDIAGLSIDEAELVKLITDYVNNTSSPMFWNESLYGQHQKDMVKQLVPSAFLVYYKYGIFPSVMMCQKVNETGWYWDNDIYKDGWNSFNIKWNEGDGLRTSKMYYDPVEGSLCYYRAYESHEAGIMGYGQFLNDNSRYASALEQTNGLAMILGISNAGYATDGFYYSKCEASINVGGWLKWDELAQQMIKELAGKYPSGGQGSWEPGSSMSWLDKYPVDQSKVSTNAKKVLYETSKWFGSWYAYGGTRPPEKDKNGVWKKPLYTGYSDSVSAYEDPGFDCSYYMMYCIQSALGINISRTTYSQIKNENISIINKNELKTGDLVWSSGHVAMYLCPAEQQGSFYAIEAQQSGTTLGVHILYDRNFTNYLRVKGMN